MENNGQIPVGLWHLEKEDNAGENGVWAADVGVSVVGLSTLFSPDVGVFRKCVWGVTLGVALLVLVGVITGQAAHFFSYPVYMDVQIFYNDSLVSPAITICPSPRGLAVDLNPLAVQEEYQNLFQQRPYPGLKEAIMVLKEELDAKELWDRVGWNVSAMIERCYQGRGKVCEETGDFIKTYTIFGACVTYKGDPATLPGSYHGLYLRLVPDAKMKRSIEEEDELYEEVEAETEVVDLDDKTKSRGWWVVVHGAGEDPSLIIKTHGYLVGVNWNKDISVSLKLYMTTSTRKRRCEDDPNYSLTGCQTECFAAAFVEKRGCRLPFMPVDAPYCRGEGVEDTLTEMLIKGKWRQGQCQCPPPCVHALYNYRGDTNDDRTDGRGRIKVFFLDLMYEKVTENLSYPFSSLVADFGGMTGLLLGASLLTLLELLECLVVGLARLYRRHGRRTQITQSRQRLPGSLYAVSSDRQLPGAVYVIPPGYTAGREAFQR